MEILYHDEYLVAVNKPAGLLVHPSDIDRREKKSALQILRNKIGHYVYPIHRLDKPTSGVLLFGLSPTVAKDMSDLFLKHTIVKKYWAVVRGYTKDSDTIDYPLKRIIDRYGKPITKADEKQSAKTRYRRRATLEIPIAVDKYPTSRYSLVELIPLTGRRHQLRRHMKHISHPIVGDTKYGKRTHNAFFKNTYHCSRLLLAAVSLTFAHPYTLKELTIHAKPDDSFMAISKLFNPDHAIGSSAEAQSYAH